jgi:hypothetical protein
MRSGSTSNSNPGLTSVKDEKSVASTLSPNSGSADELVGGYTRGSHRAIFQIQFCVRVLECESELYEQLFAEADNLGDSRYEDGFLGICQPAMKTFIKQINEVFLVKGVNKLLVLLDVLDTLTHTLPRYKKVIVASNNADAYVLCCAVRSSVCCYAADEYHLALFCCTVIIISRPAELILKSLSDVSEAVGLAVERAFIEYRTYVEQYVLPPSKNKQQGKDGALYTLTIEV